MHFQFLINCVKSIYSNIWMYTHHLFAVVKQICDQATSTQKMKLYRRCYSIEEKCSKMSNKNYDTSLNTNKYIYNYEMKRSIFKCSLMRSTYLLYWKWNFHGSPTNSAQNSIIFTKLHAPLWNMRTAQCINRRGGNQKNTLIMEIN